MNKESIEPLKRAENNDKLYDLSGPLLSNYKLDGNTHEFQLNTMSLNLHNSAVMVRISDNKNNTINKLVLIVQ